MTYHTLTNSPGDGPLVRVIVLLRDRITAYRHVGVTRVGLDMKALKWKNGRLVVKRFQRSHPHGFFMYSETFDEHNHVHRCSRCSRALIGKGPPASCTGILQWGHLLDPEPIQDKAATT